MQLDTSRELIEVLKPGMLTTVQDLGRKGFQQFGMVVGGAMDTYALRIGNILVGNAEAAAGLEITLIGPTLRFLEDTIIAITGGDLSPSLDGEPLQMWRTQVVEKGSVLAFGKLQQGIRAYLLIKGGIDVPVVLGSRSTYLKAGIGGYEGRALQSGDRLRAYTAWTAGGVNIPPHLLRISLDPTLIPKYTPNLFVRVILGPQLEAFTQQAVTDFLNYAYQITPQSDRMGYRLNGKKLQHGDTADIISDAIVMGSIQVPASGDPIILLADRQTTGGYPKIATIISVDLPLVAQAKPGDSIRFKEVAIEEAQQLYIQQERRLKLVKAVMMP